jgi:hypothetical protein
LQRQCLCEAKLAQPGRTNGWNASDRRERKSCLNQSLYANTIADLTDPSTGVLPDAFLLQVPASGNQPARYQYYFFEAFDGQKICSGGVLGETFKTRLPNSPIPVIVLCPNSFSHGLTGTLGNIAPRPAPRGQQGSQPVTALEPDSFTLLHELYHFCPWNPTTRAVNIVDVNVSGLDPCEYCDPSINFHG